MDTHVTKDGRTLKMVEMDNTHLHNTAILFVRQINEVLRISRMREFSLLNGITFSERKASEIIEYAKQKIKDCIFELTLREQYDSIKEIGEELNGIYQRTTGIPFTFMLDQAAENNTYEGFVDDEDPF